MLEIWLRPWALVQPDQVHRIALRGQDIEIGDNHAASIWLYETNGERAAVNGKQDATEPVSGFESGDEGRRLSVIPLSIRNTPGISISNGDRNTRVQWPSAPERPPTKLEPQTEKEKEAHRLMLRAQAVWGRLRDVETALGDPARLWHELRRRWTEKGDSIPPSMDVVAQHAFALWRTIEELARSPRRILRRTHQHIPISRVQELDRRAMTWLVRQPGETLAERAGDQQRILAVAREENFDTLENRVLRAYCELASHAARDYLELNRTKRLTTRARKVDAFGRSSRRLARYLADHGVRLADPGVTPNFVLQHNVNYHRVWTSWQELLDRDRVLDELWRWQGRSWEEFCTLAVVVALAGIPGAELIAAAPLDFLKEQNRGSWISHDNPLAAFYLPQQKLIVEVRYRMRKPEKRLSDFAAPISIRFGRIGDVAGFLGNVVVWPIWAIQGGLIDGELTELERVLAIGTKANILAAAILRPSRSDEHCDFERSKGALCLSLGTQSTALWMGLSELTHLFTSTLTPGDRK
ncbi:DUF2357 domain-containing protein [Bradyrhizobium sp. JYMT SZCCT0180]|uniref:DUF2357 domain-containing protein n=1 Tax=Bradyrhizobium sp. JYMT SZCCT0180 TaxID=2807666 RepID=UPI001BACA754|nr:DUF2357 domain-containing protein [Bradyrhizobium sp. JYMT SZCCT0180]